MNSDNNKKEISTIRRLFLGRLNNAKAFYELSLVLGLLLIVFEIFIYRDTLISVLIPIGIILTVGVIAFIFTKEHYRRTYGVSGTFFPLMQSVCSWGFVTCYVFMATNYYFSSSETSRLEVKILTTGHLGKGKHGCEEPYCEVKVNGATKKMIFPCGLEIGNNNTVILIVKKGGLGFEIFIDKELANKK